MLNFTSAKLRESQLSSSYSKPSRGNRHKDIIALPTTALIMQCEAGAISIGPRGFQTTDLDIRMFQRVEEQKRLVFLTFTHFGLMLGFYSAHPSPLARQ